MKVNRYYTFIAVQALVSLLLLPFNLCAQLTTANVAGTVTDGKAGVVRDAKVTISNLENNEQRLTATNSTGGYEFTFVAPGQYAVSVEAPQFKISVAKLAVAGGDRARVDLAMEIGEFRQIVNVSPPSPLLHSDTSTVSATLPEAAVQNLPLRTRNPTDLAAMVPGGSEASSLNGLSSGQRPDDRRQTSSFSVNGQDDALNNYLIDGTDNNERTIGTIGVKPSIMLLER
jgi:hypothetical protein